MTEKASLGTYIPKPLKQQLKEDDAAITEVVEAALEAYYGAGTDDTELLRQQLDVQKEKRAIVEEKIERGYRLQREGEQELAEIRQTEENLEAMLDNLQADAAEYDDELAAVIEDLEANPSKHIFVDHPRIQRIAAAHDETPDTVIYDLEAVSDLPTDRFRPMNEVESTHGEQLLRPREEDA